MALLSNSEAKTFLGIADADTSYDDLFDLMLPGLEDFTIRYCNSEFKDSEGVQTFPYGLKLAAATYLKYVIANKGISAESIGDYSISFFVDMPANIKFLFKPFKQVKFL